MIMVEDSQSTLLLTAKALSTVASTASFDKNPQSKERGITLDLGFSSFTVPFPAHLTRSDSSTRPGSESGAALESGSSGCGSQYESVQFTLVDCPGHASLIRTIIGGIVHYITDGYLVTWQSSLSVWKGGKMEIKVFYTFHCPHQKTLNFSK